MYSSTHSFNPTPDAGKFPHRFTSGKYSGTQSQSGLFEEEKNDLPPPGFEPRTVQSLAQSLYGLRYPGTKRITFSVFFKGRSVLTRRGKLLY
jgi:hypothetical protein